MSVEVHGGVGGLEVQYDELARTSRRLAEDGGDLLGLAADRHRLLLDGDLLASAVLAPGSFARAEGTLLTALDGGDGVARAGAALELRAVQLLLAVARYRASDALDEQAAVARRWRALATAPTLIGAGLARVGLAAVRGDDPGAELEEVLSEHPGVIDDALGLITDVTAPLSRGLVGPLPVMVDQSFRARTGQALLPRDLSEVAGLLALRYGPGRPVSEARPDASPAAVLAPRGLGDLLTRLHHRNATAQVATGTQGDLGVTRLVCVGPDGRTAVSWVVDLPGTKDWQVDPSTRPALNDLASNLELMAGEENARVQALERALLDAGAAPGQPIMLVGHSQGGMVAMRAAQELAGRLDVTHVVTAGSPVGVMRPAAGVQVLSLENRRDLVPHADGRGNDDDDDHVTVVFDRAGRGIGDHHGIDTAYLPAAQALDRSSDPSVRAWLTGASAFLTGRDEQVTATTTVFDVRNAAAVDGQ